MSEVVITPSVRGWVLEKRMQNLTTLKAIAEIVDNSFDAAAKSVIIAEAHDDDHGKLIIDDDGIGASSLDAMLTPGNHEEHASTSSGTYGIGLKDAAIWLAKDTFVRTTRGGVTRSVLVQWDELRQWRVPNGSERRSSPSENGTRITMSRLFRRLRLNDLAAGLGHLYAPAIEQGLSIEIRTISGAVLSVRAPIEPLLVDVIDDIIEVDGKKAHVRVGIVPDGQHNPSPGIDYVLGRRVIIPHTALGCNGYSTRNIRGRVTLLGSGDDSWRLRITKNKDEIGTHKDDLGEAVFELLEPMLETAARQTKTVRLDGIKANLTDAVNDILGTPDPRKRSGKKNPDSTRKKPQPRDRSRRGSLIVDYKHVPGDALGEIDAPGHRVWLAENHPWIAHLIETDNEDALLAHVVDLWTSVQVNQPQPELPTADGEATRLMEQASGRLLVRWDSMRVSKKKKAQ